MTPDNVDRWADAYFRSGHYGRKEPDHSDPLWRTIRDLVAQIGDDEALKEILRKTERELSETEGFADRKGAFIAALEKEAEWRKEELWRKEKVPEKAEKLARKLEALGKDLYGRLDKEQVIRLAGKLGEVKIGGRPMFEPEEMEVLDEIGEDEVGKILMGFYQPYGVQMTASKVRDDFVMPAWKRLLIRRKFGMAGSKKAIGTGGPKHVKEIALKALGKK